MDLSQAMIRAVEIVKQRQNPKGSVTLKYLDMDEKPASIQAVFLGKGMFTRAYLGEDNWVYLVTKHELDYSKEMLSEIYRYDGAQPHIPVLEKVGWKGEKTVYRSPLYNAPLRKKNGEKAWKQFRKVQAAREWANRAIPYSEKRTPYWGHRLNSDTIERYGKDDSVKEALEELTSGIANYGSEYAFEFSPRNLATDGAGQLIFLDVLFNLRSVSMKA
jgi:hypothetical protein